METLSVGKGPYIALAQVEWKDRTEAFGIENGILDFDWLARNLLNHFSDCLWITLYDNRLEKQGIWRNQ